MCEVSDCTRNRGAELQYCIGGSTLMSDEQYCDVGSTTAKYPVPGVCTGPVEVPEVAWSTVLSTRGEN